MRKTADVVIIGGGVAGVNALYYLAEAGVTETVLVEMETLGSGTTAYSSAYVTLQEPDELITMLSMLSFPEFQAFKDRFQFDVGDLTRGSLSLDTIENAARMIRRAERQEALGVPTQVLNPDEIRRLAPFLNTLDLGPGLLCKHGGAVDAHAFMQAYVKHATRMGAEAHEHVKATGITVENQKVTGVDTTHGHISTPNVINAAGVYAKLVGRWVGLELPLTNSLRHTLLTEPSSLIDEHMSMLEILNPLEIYVEAKGQRADFTLGVDETDDFEHVADLKMVVGKYGDDIAYRMPAIAKLGIVSVIAGIRTLTPDGRPILGPVDTLFGYFNDCGWGGSGVSLAPGGGKLIAESITGTKNPLLGVEPFLLGRFQK